MLLKLYKTNPLLIFKLLALASKEWAIGDSSGSGESGSRTNESFGESINGLEDGKNRGVSTDVESDSFCLVCLKVFVSSQKF